MDTLWRQTNVTFPRFKNATLESYEPRDESQEEALAQVIIYCNLLPASLKSGQGLTFVGPPGTGKTMLASIVLNEATKQKYSVDALEMSTFVRLHHSKFDMNNMVNRLGSDLPPDLFRRWEELDDRIRSLRRSTAFVLFDDVGKEYDSGSGWANSIWDDILRYRFNRCRPTIITTNTPIALWAERYSPSMESFLHDSTTIITLTGQDQRKAQ